MLERERLFFLFCRFLFNNLPTTVATAVVAGAVGKG